MPAPIIAIAPNKEAAALIRNKPYMSKKVFAGLIPELKARAFVITGLEQWDIVQDVRDALATLPEGGDWEEIKDTVIAKISPWFTQKSAEKRAELLLRTHGFQAYAVANYRRLEENADIFPYRQYLSSDDLRVRPTHYALHGKIFPSSSPFWHTHTPPWEWGCRCDVVGLGEEEAMEIKAEDDGKHPMERRFMEGQFLQKVELENKLVARITLPNGKKQDVQLDVSTPWEKGQGVGYQFEPGSLGMNVNALKARYDPQTWQDFEQWAKLHHVEELKMSVWDWLVNPPKWKPGQPLPGQQPTAPGEPEPEIIIIEQPEFDFLAPEPPEPAQPAPIKLPGNGMTLWLDPDKWPKDFLGS